MSETPNPTRSQPARPGAARETVTELLKPFTAEAAATRAAIEDRSRIQHRINHWLISLVAGIAVAVILMLVILVQNRQRSNQTREVIRASADTSAQIADCTTPGGTCFQQSQQRLASAYDYLTWVQVYSMICLRDHPDADAAELKKCIDRSVTSTTAPAK